MFVVITGKADFGGLRDFQPPTEDNVCCHTALPDVCREAGKLLTPYEEQCLLPLWDFCQVCQVCHFQPPTGNKIPYYLVSGPSASTGYHLSTPYEEQCLLPLRVLYSCKVRDNLSTPYGEQRLLSRSLTWEMASRVCF